MTSVARARRRIAGGAVTAVAAAVMALAAGCTSAASSSSSAPVPAPATTPAAPTSAPATTAAPSPTSATPAPSSSASATSPARAAGAAPACATDILKVTPGLAEGAAGSAYQVIDFTNLSGEPCTLFGYPGVALAGGAPVTQIGAAASRSTATAATLVTLAAGGTANALLRITDAGNYPTSECDPVASTYLQIYPPNQTTPVYVAYTSTGCSSTAVNLLSVGVVQPGSGG
ncbi:DUF4232 domain-containing protein [Trebonia sp.]|uniref:DUF4232 domain-containing protein n=1 Tax=Trebonia sp. TaxID=2767075 RepID=UPI00263592BE|nr:DUF4232 domain-containing protein [Trebonia sp.]